MPSIPLAISLILFFALDLVVHEFGAFWRSYLSEIVPFVMGGWQVATSNCSEWGGQDLNRAIDMLLLFFALAFSFYWFSEIVVEHVRDARTQG